MASVDNISAQAQGESGVLCTFYFLRFSKLIPSEVKAMNKDTVTRIILFSFFFAAGLSVMMLSLLFNDIYGYYQNKHILAEAKGNIERLKTLNNDYDALLRQLHSDNQFAQRLASATLGIEPKEKDVAYPRETASQLAAARVALMKETESATGGQRQPPLPRWVERCKASNRRLALFIAGSALILIAFTYFGPQFKTSPVENTNKTPALIS